MTILFCLFDCSPARSQPPKSAKRRALAVGELEKRPATFAGKVVPRQRAQLGQGEQVAPLERRPCEPRGGRPQVEGTRGGADRLSEQNGYEKTGFTYLANYIMLNKPDVTDHKEVGNPSPVQDEMKFTGFIAEASSHEVSGPRDLPEVSADATIKPEPTISMEPEGESQGYVFSTTVPFLSYFLMLMVEFLII